MGTEVSRVPLSTGELAHRLDWALFKYGRAQRGPGSSSWEIGPRTVSFGERQRFRSINPYAAQIVATAIHRAVSDQFGDDECHDCGTSIHMVTVLDRRWHMPWNAGNLDHTAIINETRGRLRGLNYLLFLELGLLEHLGTRRWAPHFHGFFFEPPSRRKLKPFRARFAGGVAEAPSMLIKPVTNLSGACRYCIKIPMLTNTSYRALDGRLIHRGRRFYLSEHFRYCQLMGNLECTDLVIAGGKGRKLLKAANRALDQHYPSGPLARRR